MLVLVIMISFLSEAVVGMLIHRQKGILGTLTMILTHGVILSDARAEA